MRHGVATFAQEFGNVDGITPNDIGHEAFIDQGESTVLQQSKDGHCALGQADGVQLGKIDFIHEELDIIYVIVLDGPVKAFKIMFGGHTRKDLGKDVLGGRKLGLPLVMANSNRCTFRIPLDLGKALG